MDIDKISRVSSTYRIVLIHPCSEGYVKTNKALACVCVILLTHEVIPIHFR